MSTWRLPRRSFLKGAGYSLLLPALDVMMPAKASAQAMLPPRFVSFFMSLGIWGRGYDPTKNDASRYPDIASYKPGGLGVWAPTATGPLSAPLPPAAVSTWARRSG